MLSHAVIDFWSSHDNVTVLCYFFTCHDNMIEHVNVGSEAVLDSPHVSEGPGRIANSPVPSIFVDDRGEIHRLRVGGKRVNMLFSKKDVMRSGYLHNHKTFSFIISGKVELWLLGMEGTNKTIYEAGSFCTVNPWYPHILHFCEYLTIHLDSG
jgi:hypothetical protein